MAEREVDIDRLRGNLRARGVNIELPVHDEILPVHHLIGIGIEQSEEPGQLDGAAGGARAAIDAIRGRALAAADAARVGRDELLGSAREFATAGVLVERKAAGPAHGRVCAKHRRCTHYVTAGRLTWTAVAGVNTVRNAKTLMSVDQQLA